MAFVHQEDGSLTATLPQCEDDITEALEHIQGSRGSTPYRHVAHNEIAVLLNTAQQAHYVSNVAKLLYLATHTRPDVLTATVMLTQYSNSPNVDNLLALQQVGEYLRAHKHLGLRICRSDLQLHASADASHQQHENCAGHTGFCLWFGETNAPFLVRSEKQKITTRASMESELVALDRCSKHITQALGLCVELECPQHAPALVEQDNYSLILALDKGTYKGSTKHINSRFQTVLGQIRDRVFEPVFTRTSVIRADHLTKPQTERFAEWRDKLLN